MNADEHVCFLVLPRSFSRFPTHESAALAECAQNLNASVVRCSSMLPSNDAELQAMIPASSILVLCLSSAEALMLGGFADISYATLLESAQRLCPGRVALLFRGPDRDAHSAREFVDSLAARGNRLPPQYAAVFSAKLAFAADSEYAAFVAQLPRLSLLLVAIRPGVRAWWSSKDVLKSQLPHPGSLTAKCRCRRFLSARSRHGFFGLGCGSVFCVSLLVVSIIW
jgi:hypothetical protein